MIGDNSFKNESFVILLSRVGCNAEFMFKNGVLNELASLEGKSGLVAWFLYGQYKEWDARTSIKNMPESLAEYAARKDLFLQDWSSDAFSTQIRCEGNLSAISMGLNFAIFQGGLTLDSSKFCKARNNLIYSRDEVCKWERKFKMPYKYDPFIDLGGFNCRHTLDWISTELAAEMFEENLTAKIERYKELKMI